jgi:WD40 repeat protein
MIYTFYSYKGGVGRSMALANIAECLYRRGARVLMIDWDLEAPGLEQFFFSGQQRLDGVRSCFGVIDMLLDYKRQFAMARQATKRSEEDPASARTGQDRGRAIFDLVRPNLLPFEGLLYPIHPPESSGNLNSPALWLLPAGWRATAGAALPPNVDESDQRFSKYAQAVQSFDWADFYANFEGETYFKWLRDEILGAPISLEPSNKSALKRVGFDAVLIDSRTGVTEMGGVCTRQLADVIVSFCAPNYQNFEGVRTMSASFLRKDVEVFRGGHLPEMLVIPARLDLAGETDEQNRFRRLFEDNIKNPPTFERLGLKMWNLRIPYIAKYAYREALTVGVLGSNQELEEAYWKLATHLVLFADEESRLRVHFASDLQRLAPTDEHLTLTGHRLYLSFNNADRKSVAEVQKLLEGRGIATFVDRKDLVAGLPWSQALEEELGGVDGVAVFVGRDLGTWQKREMWFALDRQVREEKQGRIFPVIPVLLPGADLASGFLFLNSWIDLRAGGPGLVVGEVLEAFERAIRSTELVQTSGRPSVICPYRGLQVFREEDAAFFFGRQALAHRLLDFTLTKGLVAVIGASGIGKSSLVQAGLLPLLRRQRPPNETWDAVSFMPGNDPFNRLASTLMPLLEPGIEASGQVYEAQKLGQALAAGTTTLDAIVARVIERSNGTARLLLVADQFEELFTLTPEPCRRPFARMLLSSLGKTPLTLLIAVRADFYSQVITLDRELSDRFASAAINIGEMAREEVQVSITAPARLVGLEFEPGLVERIVADLDREPGQTPLLEFTLTELWQHREGNQLTNRAYDEIGGIPPALGQRAEAGFLRLNPEEQAATRRLFSRLVRAVGKDKTGGYTRQRMELNEPDVITRRVVNLFADARVLVTSAATNQGTFSVELAHEALIRNWERLKAWLNEDREFLSWRERLEAQVEDWQGHARDVSYLLTGALLSEAEQWVGRRPEDLTAAEQQLIRESAALRNRKKRARFLYVTAGTCILMVSTVAVWRTEKDATTTSLARALAGQSMVLQSKQPDVAALLAVESLRLAASSEGTAAMEKSLAYLRRRVAVLRHLASVDSIAFSPDGISVVTGSLDKTARIWVARTGQLVAELEGHSGPVYSAAFSPDGIRVVTASSDKTARIWAARTGQLVAELEGHSGPVYSAAFSPDGQSVVTASSDETARIWAARTGQLVAILKGDVGPVYSAAFSPDGRRIVTGSFDNTARIWDVVSGREIGLPLVHGAGISSVAFSPDGRSIAAGSFDGSTKVWDAGTGEQLLLLAGHLSRSGGGSVAWSPNGKRLATVNPDKSVTVWDSVSGKALQILNAQTAGITYAAWSPDGKWLATGSSDGMADVWDSNTGTDILRLPCSNQVNVIAFSPDGKYLAAASQDGTSRVFNLARQPSVTGPPAQLSAEACSLTTRNLTLQEWQQYLGIQPYRKTCPEVPSNVQ